MSTQYVGRSSSNSQPWPVSLSRLCPASFSADVSARWMTSSSSARASSSSRAEALLLLSSSSSASSASMPQGTSSGSWSGELALELIALEKGSPAPPPSDPTSVGTLPVHVPEAPPSGSFSLSLAGGCQNGQVGFLRFTLKRRKKVVLTRSCRIGCSWWMLASCTVSTSHVCSTSPRTPPLAPEVGRNSWDASAAANPLPAPTARTMRKAYLWLLDVFI
mmetsp:Transcript_73137/g.158197  ORF Transcript_73137/g.158197 Transcript_73137/m.158197 type:complete len:219 (-) Transcript_73137:73-729(-)